MKKRQILLVAAALLAVSAPARSQEPVFNQPPLQETAWAELPLGAIRPRGWLLEQLQRQADGLTGHLDEVYPQVMGPDNAWLGGDGDAWERGPYWIDGLLPLAYQLQDKALQDKAGRWVEAMLRSAREDGYFGPAEDHPFVYGLQRGASHDWWPKMVALKILKQHYMATGDERVISLMSNYFRYQLATLPSCPLDHYTDWGRWRGADNLELVYWLYNLTGEPFLLELGELIHAQTAPWARIFQEGTVFATQNSLHTVNLAQGFKAPVVYWQYSGDAADLWAPKEALRTIRHTIGLPTGLWAGDEQIHFGSPTRGSELCAAVEMMFSTEEMLRLTADPSWADALERIAFNALPTQANDTYTAKQYYQQTNQIACTRDWRPFSTPHDDTDVLFGTLNGYPCCLSNMHQGWPKFTQNLWYATADGGLVAAVYAPNTVAATVGGTQVRIEEETLYPFSGTIRFRIHFPARKVRSASFPLYLRIPAWATGASFQVNGRTLADGVQGGTVIRLCPDRWNDGDVISLELPMQVAVEEWYDRSWSVVRGPLVYALAMEETWTQAAFTGPDRYYGDTYWEVRSSSPWNYCLMRDRFSPDQCRVEASPSVAAYPWTVRDAPLSLWVPARELPQWKAQNGSVGEIPYFTEDGNDTGADVTIRLIPYGCTTLRIAQFPTRIVPWDVDLRK